MRGTPVILPQPCPLLKSVTKIVSCFCSCSVQVILLFTHKTIARPLLLDSCLIGSSVIWGFGLQEGTHLIIWVFREHQPSSGFNNGFSKQVTNKTCQKSSLVWISPIFHAKLFTRMLQSGRSYLHSWHVFGWATITKSRCFSSNFQSNPGMFHLQYEIKQTNHTI